MPSATGGWPGRPDCAKALVAGAVVDAGARTAVVATGFAGVSGVNGAGKPGAVLRSTAAPVGGGVALRLVFAELKPVRPAPDAGGVGVGVNLVVCFGGDVGDCGSNFWYGFFLSSGGASGS